MATAVFGATGSIGSALARRLAASGGTPWLIGRNADKLAALSAECNQAPFTTVDVLEPESIGPAISAAMPSVEAATGGHVHGLAYCVGDVVLKPLRRATTADFETCFRLHVVGAAEAVKSVVPALKKSGGSIVLFSSVAVQQGFTNHAVISSAKGAVEGLTRALAAELAPNRVRVNCVAPSISHSTLAASMPNSPKATMIASGMVATPQSHT